MATRKIFSEISFSDTSWISLFLQEPFRRLCAIKGYVNVYCPNHPSVAKSNVMPVHRLIMESHLGRYLEKDEVVHHINQHKTDNRIDNLKVMTNSEHRKLHISLGEHNKGIKKHESKLRSITNLRKKGLFAKEISLSLDIPRRTVQRYIKEIDLGGHSLRLKRLKRNVHGRFV